MAALLIVSHNLHPKHAIRLTTTHGEQAMRTATGQWLREVEIVGIFLRRFLMLHLLHDLAAHDGPTTKDIAHPFACRGVLADLLRHDVAGASQCFPDILHVTLDEALGSGLGVTLALQKKQRGERLKATLTCHLRLRPAARLIGKIDVFQFGCVPAVIDALDKRVSEFALILNRTDDGLLAFLHVLQLMVHVADGGNLNLVQSARALLAVAGDEGNRAALVKQGERGVNLSIGNLERLGYVFCECAHWDCYLI